MTRFGRLLLYPGAPTSRILQSTFPPTNRATLASLRSAISCSIFWASWPSADDIPARELAFQFTDASRVPGVNGRQKRQAPKFFRSLWSPLRKWPRARRDNSEPRPSGTPGERKHRQFGRESARPAFHKRPRRPPGTHRHSYRATFPLRHSRFMGPRDEDSAAAHLLDVAFCVPRAPDPLAESGYLDCIAERSSRCAT